MGAGNRSVGLVGALQSMVPDNPRGATAQLKKELGVQLAVRGDHAAKWGDFQKQVERSRSLRVMGWARPGSTAVHLIHSIGVFSEIGTSSPLRDETIGFWGDYTRLGPPKPMKIPPQNGWKYKECKICTDGDAMVAYYADGSKDGSFWQVGQADAKEKVWLPRLVLLPTILGEYCAQKRREGKDLYEEVSRMVCEGTIMAAEAKLVQQWSLAVMQTATANKSPVCCEIDGILEDEHIFETWCADTLEMNFGSLSKNLGASGVIGHDQMQMMQALGSSMGQSMGQYMGQSVGTSLGVQATSGQHGQAVQTGKAAAAKPEGGYVFKKWQIAAVCGFTGTTDAKKVQPIWKDWQTSKEVEQHRQDLWNRMCAYAEKRPKFEIDECVFYYKSTMKELVACRFNPGELVATYRGCNKGLSPLNNMPKDVEQIERAREIEDARRESGDDPNFAEALRLLASDPPAPPEDYASLLLLVTTTTAQLWVMFGGRCDLFQKMELLRLQLKHQMVARYKAKFTPYKCREYTWAMISEFRQYFSQKVTYADLTAPGGPVWPTSMMGNLIAKVQYVEECKRPLFPEQWKTVNYSARGGTKVDTLLPVWRHGWGRPVEDYWVGVAMGTSLGLRCCLTHTNSSSSIRIPAMCVRLRLVSARGRLVAHLLRRHHSRRLQPRGLGRRANRWTCRTARILSSPGSKTITRSSRVGSCSASFVQLAGSRIFRCSQQLPSMFPTARTRCAIANAWEFAHMKVGVVTSTIRRKGRWMMPSARNFVTRQRQA